MDTRSSILGKKIKQEIKRRGCNEEFIIGIPDRNIEVWILADWDNFIEKMKIKRKISKINAEGRNGKTLIEKIIDKETKYQKTIQGVSLLSTINPEKVSERSESFKEFWESISVLNCKEK